MDLKKLKFEAGTSGYSALNNKHHAYICPEERADLHICCAASDESTALALRQHVLDVLQHAKTAATINMGRLYMNVPEGSDMAVTYKGQHYPLLGLLAKADTLQAEIDQLRQQLHDHDRRRDASMELARTLAEGVDSAPTDLPKHTDDHEPAGCPQCFGFEHLDCICHDSGNAPA